MNLPLRVVRQFASFDDVRIPTLFPPNVPGSKIVASKLYYESNISRESPRIKEQDFLSFYRTGYWSVDSGAELP